MTAGPDRLFLKKQRHRAVHQEQGQDRVDGPGVAGEELFHRSSEEGPGQMGAEADGRKAYRHQAYQRQVAAVDRDDIRFKGYH